MVDLLVENPLLLLFVVVVLSYPIGRVRLAGSSFGVASVLFAGIAVGAIDEEVRLPQIVYELGLILFVYTVGLANGRVFFGSLRRRGLRDGAFVVGMLAIAALLVVAARYLLDLSSALAAGAFAGSMTNTPALAAVLDYVEGSVDAGAFPAMLDEPVVAYSVTYPMGVIGVILAILVAQRFWRIDYEREAARAGNQPGTPRRLENRTVEVTRDDPRTESLEMLRQRHAWDVVFGRLRRDGTLTLARADTRLMPGDLVSVIGTADQLDHVTEQLGRASDEHLEIDRAQLDFRRIFVSDHRVAGQRLRDLNLPQQFGAVVTRVRRGDVEFLPTGDTVLELGDRVRVVTRRENMVEVTRFFGDSYRALSEIDVPTFSLGLAAGLVLGLLPIPLPGGIEISLGLAGGPLLVALTLGALERTGSLVWTLPYSANLTLRQIGLILFLAGVGTRAGHAFVETLRSSEGIALFAAGTVVTFVTALLALAIGYRLMGVPFGLLLGMLAGLQTQPAVLGFALEQTRDDLPNVGYAAIFPFAAVAKIIVAQVLIAVLLRL
jgi:putative transport protein